jgi:hypothetical protein
MVMLDQVLPPWLVAYIDIISEYNSLYGPRVWAFLYQTDVRFRSEHMTFMAMRESDRMDLALALNQTTEYNPAKPWDFLWKMAVDINDSQESRWWYRNFERRIPMFLEQGAGGFIDGDARVAASLDGHFATTHNSVNQVDRNRPDSLYGAGGGGGGNKQRGGGPKAIKDKPKPPPAPAPHQPGQKHLSTKKGAELCAAYNSGSCVGEHGKSCPRDSTKRHLCHWCLGMHPGNNCDPNAAKARKQQNQNTRKGGKGDKGGKGGKGSKEK